METIVLATSNTHKVEEFNQLFTTSAATIVSARAYGGMPAVEETGRTFQANAYLKAAALSQKLKKSHWVLSDDSGLEVDFLKGAPGIFSARYAGAQASDEENVEKLIDALKGLPKRQRRARFRCVLCLIDCHRGLYYFEGACEGHVQLKPKGASGFGYDPIFVPKGYQQSFAQLGEAVKAELSHRAEAVRALSNFLKKQF